MTKLRGRTSLATGLILAAMIPGLACDSGEFAAHEGEDNEFGILLEGLGDDITTCTAATAGSDYNTSTEVLTVTLGAGQDAVVSAVAKKLLFNGRQCAVSGGDLLTTDNVSQLIVVADAGGSQKVVIDLLPGTFGNNLMGNNGGIIVRDSGTGTVAVGIRGTDQANNIRVAEDGANNFFFELTGNLVSDLKLEGTFGTGPSNAITVALGDGNDVFNAQDNTNLTAANVGTTGTMAAVTSAAFTVYGGVGNDTIEGGDGDDTLYGGEGNDTFETSDHDDGSDTYSGGAGTDTLSYEQRTDGVVVDIHHGSTNTWVQGTASLFNHATITTGTVMLVLTINGNAVTADNDTAGDISSITEILADLNDDLGANGTASVDDQGRLFIEAPDAGNDITGITDSVGLLGHTTAVTAPTGGDVLPDADDGKLGENDEVLYDVENLVGSDQADTLVGSDVTNVIEGGDGNDKIYGGIANGTCANDVDVLKGEDGDDTFYMGPVANCADDVTGGSGNDTVDFQQRLVALTINLNNQADDGVTGTEGDNIRSGVEVVLGGEGNDVITGSSGNEELHGGLGDDVIDGGSGNDTLIGNPGADQLFGGAGDDTINEADAADGSFLKTMDTFSGLDKVHGGTGTNLCDYSRAAGSTDPFNLCYSSTTSLCSAPGPSGPELDELTNCSHLIATPGNETITGSDEADIIEGGAGNDTISGGAGADTLYGDAGDDTITGGDGDDTLDGGGDGTESLDGQAGEDVCLGANGGTVNNCEL